MDPGVAHCAFIHPGATGFRSLAIGGFKLACEEPGDVSGAELRPAPNPAPGKK